MSSSQFVVVATEFGPVRGDRKCSILGREIISFQGIPYMKAPVGKLRFRDAQLPEPWTEAIDVTNEPPSYWSSNFLTEKIEGTEDAGVINVFIPEVTSRQPLPVMVLIHGGGFYSGSSKTDLYGPDYFLQKDVVFVSFNYRVGVCGFLSLEDKELNVPGNAGLKDQNFALKWIQRNIVKFGGDPNNVTLFGSCAGAISTHLHMISDMSRGLFHRSIVMSGSAFNSLIPRRDFAQRLAKELGWNGIGGEKAILEFLESADAEKIVQASGRVLTTEEEFGEHISIPFGPVIEPYVSDNCFIPKEPVLMAREAWSNGIDSIMGMASFEGLFRAKYELEKASSTLQNFDYFTLVRQMAVDIRSDKISEYGEKIKQIYFGMLLPSPANEEPYYHFISDAYFLHGIQRAVLSRVNTSAGGKTFFYRFDCDPKLSLVKKCMGTEAFAGASHWDQMTYLFKFNPVFGLVDSPRIGDEMSVITRMINIWTNFAIYGITQVSELGLADWKPLTPTADPILCLNISNQKVEVDGVFLNAARTEQKKLSSRNNIKFD